MDSLLELAFQAVKGFGWSTQDVAVEQPQRVAQSDWRKRGQLQPNEQRQPAREHHRVPALMVEHVGDLLKAQRR
jgi:hypothetical protein